MKPNHIVATRHRVVFAAALLLATQWLLGNDQDQKDDSVDWLRWGQHDPDSVAEVQYRPLNSILETVVVDNRGEVQMRYAVMGAAKPLHYLARYIEYMEGIPVSKLNRDEQLAYWLNLHNLGIIHLFAAQPRAKSRVKKLRGTPGNPGEHWNKKTFTIEGQALSLEDIEQNIIFAQWQDPFTIYGLCYGVKGSPVVGVSAFTGKNVHAQLRQAGEIFVNNHDNVRTNRKGVKLSSLYIWNKNQLFNNDDSIIINHVQSLANNKLAGKLSASSRISGDKFSWRSLDFNPRQADLGAAGGSMDYGGGS